jgi:hypothetical protein
MQQPIGETSIADPWKCASTLSGAMDQPQSLQLLRTHAWSAVPTNPGIYWWYFPESEMAQLNLHEYCNVETLDLRAAPDGKICLYHGLASDLWQRVAWHAAQKLTPSALRSGFLSTFRLTLLALNNFEYLNGVERIDRYFDGLSILWRSTQSRAEAAALEMAELSGRYHYPLNIQGNSRSELAKLHRHLRAVRKNYRQTYSSRPDCP